MKSVSWGLSLVVLLLFLVSYLYYFSFWPMHLLLASLAYGSKTWGDGRENVCKVSVQLVRRPPLKLVLYADRIGSDRLGSKRIRPNAS